MELFFNVSVDIDVVNINHVRTLRIIMSVMNSLMNFSCSALSYADRWQQRAAENRVRRC